MRSHFNSEEIEYNTIKIRAEKFFKFGPNSQISTAITAEKFLA